MLVQTSWMTRRNSEFWENIDMSSDDMTNYLSCRNQLLLVSTSLIV